MTAEGPSRVCALSNPGCACLPRLLLVQMRGCQLVESRRAALALLYEAGLGCADEARLQCLVPYLLSQVSYQAASVR